MSGAGSGSSSAAPRALYTSNASAADIAAALKACTSAVVLTHAKPDGDAIGSSVAVTRALLAMGKRAEVWHVGPYPTWMEQFVGSTPARRLNKGEAIAPGFEPDLVVVCDTGSWVQLDCVEAFVRARAARTVIIDHHISGDVDVAARRLVDSAAASATQVASTVIDSALGLDGGLFPADIARVLYLGLATDTGWFKFSNTSPACLRLAARLIESGIDAPAIYEIISQQDSPARPRLLGRALDSLQYLAGDTLACMSLTQADFQAVRADPEDTGGFSENALAVVGIRAVAVFTEMTQPDARTSLTKVSLRSKPGDDAIDVAALAAKFGGGGHARAAGIKLALPIEVARKQVMAALVAAAG